MKRFEGYLIVSDLDGTLLDAESRISPENQRAIHEFIEQGGRFTVATGRSKAGMEHFFPTLEINAPAVIYNGSVIYDFAKGEELWSACVGAAGYRLARRLMKIFPEELGIEVYAGHTPYVIQENELTRRHFQLVKMAWNPVLPEEIPQPWLSLVVNGEPEVLEQAIALIEREDPGIFFTQISERTLLEVMHREANKGVACRKVQSLLGAEPEKVFAVGDGRNDLQLLESVLHSCAPENACDAVRKIARHRLPHHTEHTIAALIERIGKGETE